jgi:2-hydroxy-6-oxonona-2,4-dienedioate hydrolase
VDRYRITSRWTDVRGHRIHARIAATGPTRRPPIVLVHGLGVSSLYFGPVARTLAADFDVYSPDLPGFGRSGGPRQALDLKELASTLLAWLDATGLDHPVLLGNSMGCQVLLELAINAPRRVDSLVLVGPTVDPRWRTFLRQVPRWLLEAFREPLAIFPILALDYARCGPKRFFETARFALNDRPEEKLRDVLTPTLVVRGERDAFVSPDWAARVADSLPHGHLATLAGAAHAAHYSAPESLARLIRTFVMQHRPVIDDPSRMGMASCDHAADDVNFPG